MNGQSSIRPMPLTLSLVFFGVPALIFLALQRIVVPALDEAGVPPLATFFILMSPHVLFFVGAFAAYRMEGNTWSWPELRERFRLHRPTGKDWAWGVAGTLGDIGSYLLVYIAARPFLKWLYDLAPEPEVIGRVFGDATTFVGYPLKDNYWLLGVFLIMFFFNVMGEELWWRGYIFPRQELTHGSHTWVVHGLLWTGFHLFSPYNAVMVLPGALLMSWIVQRRRNTWLFVLSHASLNSLAMVRIVSGIFG